MCLSHFCIYFYQTTMWFFFKETIPVYFKTFYAVAALGKSVYFSAIETEVTTDTRHRNESIFISFVKGGQAFIATEVQVTSVCVKPNSTIRLCCAWQFVYFVYSNLSRLCMTYFDYYFFSILCITLILTSTVYIYYIIHFIFFS